MKPPNRYLEMKVLLREWCAAWPYPAEELRTRTQQFLDHRKEGADAVAATSGGAAEGQAEAPLNVLDEEADQCCRRSFSLSERNAKRGWEPKADVAERFTCGVCGTEFVPEMVGPVRHWRVKAWVAVVRPQR